MYTFVPTSRFQLLLNYWQVFFLLYNKNYFIIISFYHDDKFHSQNAYIFLKGLCEKNNHNILLSICSPTFNGLAFLLILCFRTPSAFISSIPSFESEINFNILVIYELLVHMTWFLLVWHFAFRIFNIQTTRN